MVRDQICISSPGCTAGAVGADISRAGPSSAGCLGWTGSEGSKWLWKGLEEGCERPLPFPGGEAEPPWAVGLLQAGCSHQGQGKLQPWPWAQRNGAPAISPPAWAGLTAVLMWLLDTFLYPDFLFHAADTAAQNFTFINNQPNLTHGSTGKT